MLRTSLGELEFPNPLGIAAGFVKTGPEMRALQMFGFGGPSEIGSITYKAQEGNVKRPRIRRIPEAEALWNAMGFPNPGADHVASTLYDLPGSIPIGVNIGLGRNTLLDQAWKEYQLSVLVLWKHVNYITLNLSSPNTSRLRNLQKPEYLNEILHCMKVVREIFPDEKKYMGIKVSPDETDEVYTDIIESCYRYDIDYIVLVNTTTHKEEEWKLAEEGGGISGRPLAGRSLELCKMFFRELQRANKKTDHKIAIVSCGGISSGRDCFERIVSGASFCQVYTALVYQGPSFARRALRELADLLRSNGFEFVREAVGANI